ncbi:hypothetical protein [Nubsella zeaxanthinifaciens]|uniref:hypothetical protein n=1 Tax=Nubsella zeaxanthinifaciens TaxID=392412 RepID=UPI000DE27E20|nr:hypothetical protein [Nubsella zeaxanthinifaciens]
MLAKNLVLLLLLFTLSASSPSASTKQQIREMYAKSYSCKQTTQQLLKLLAVQEQNAFTLGYTGAAKMMMAKHAFNPFTKISNFNAGKKLLNVAIGKDKANTELIFLRYANQVSAPSFLGYDDHIEADKQLLLRSLASKQLDEQLAKTVISFLQQQKLTTTEKQQLTNLTQ